MGSIKDFLLAFRGQWFAAMSGGFSVPFTALAVFLDSKYQQIIFGCLAFAAVWYAAYTIWKIEREKVVSLEGEIGSKEQRKLLRDAMGGLLTEGRELQLRCSNEVDPAPETEANLWASNVEVFLQNNLGSGHVARFRDGSDLPMGATSIGSLPHRNLCGGLRVRMARLNQFIAEIPI